jgi:hypothetical protein
MGERQQARFEQKMAQRGFADKQNELIRDYERKLADMKVENNSVMDEVKQEADRNVRENSRMAKMAFDDQARAYEQKIAALEYQQKERERYLAENYQEDLEKLRRSNALLISKKS